MNAMSWLAPRARVSAAAGRRALLLGASWLAVYLVYYLRAAPPGLRDIILSTPSPTGPTTGIPQLITNQTILNDYLIYTEGCKIPNYSKTFHYEKKKATSFCRKRAVFVTKTVEKEIVFVIDRVAMAGYSNHRGYQCCYRHVWRSTDIGHEDTHIVYSKECIEFQNGTVSNLDNEIISVTCTSKKNSKKVIIYDDVYMLVKKLNGSTAQAREGKKKWNVLVVGMDTMSRARFLQTMPRAAARLRAHWLDYRAYHKVGYNTFPNLMAFLTGVNQSDIYKKVTRTKFIWDEFGKFGYRTAYGEDDLNCPDTFRNNGGFPTPPTDHYMRPLFLTGEVKRDYLVCTGRLSSGEHVLNYALDFATTYKNDAFFGLFWMNSYSHDPKGRTGQIDGPMVAFFDKLNSSGILEDTFVFFLSDHGVRFGPQRGKVESYYDERLPMLFVWVPEGFRRAHTGVVAAATANTQRLVSPYDLHATFTHVLQLSGAGGAGGAPAGCPRCASLLLAHSPARACADAAVDHKWCSCHDLRAVSNYKAPDAARSIHTLTTAIVKKVTDIATNRCTKCVEVRLRSVLRVHSYELEGEKYHVIAVVMSPTGAHYEGVVGGRGGVVGGIDLISGWASNGYCAKKFYDRGQCSCVSVKNCK